MALALPDAYYATLADDYRRRRDLLLPSLEAAGLRPFVPDGAYYVMVEIGDVTDEDDVTFARRLTADPGVASVPGLLVLLATRARANQGALRVPEARRDPGRGGSPPAAHPLRMAAAERTESFELTPRRDGAAHDALAAGGAGVGGPAAGARVRRARRTLRPRRRGRWPTPASTSTPTTFGASAPRAARAPTWTAGRSSTTISRHGSRDVRAASHGLPLVLYGHSMGGLIVLGYVLATIPRPLPDLHGAQLSRARLDHRRMEAALAHRSWDASRRSSGSRTGSAPEACRAIRRWTSALAVDPLALRSSTARLGAEAFAEQARVRGLLAGGAPLPVPTYVVHGSDDPIVPVGASEPVANDRPNVTRRVYPGLRHETHNEPEGAAVVDDTIAWIRAAALSRR